MNIASKPKMTPAEFVEAVTELARMTGKSPVLLAERCGANVTIEEPEPDLSRFNARAYCRDAAQVAANTGVSISAALASLRPEDYFDGVR